MSKTDIAVCPTQVYLYVQHRYICMSNTGGRSVGGVADEVGVVQERRRIVWIHLPNGRALTCKLRCIWHTGHGSYMTRQI